MIKRDVAISGAVVYWTLTETDREKLLATWTSLGLDTFVPAAKTPAASLKRAMRRIAERARRLVRPLEDDGYALVNEEASGQDLDYSVDLRATVDDAGVITFDPKGHPLASSISAAYTEEAAVLTGHAVGQALVRVLSTLNAAPLRETGGIYWIPEDRLATWEKAAKGVEAAAVGVGISAVYTMRTAMDDATKRAVLAAITADVQKDLALLNEEISSGDLGEKALKSRAIEAQQIEIRVAEYERLLGVALVELRKGAADVEASANLAALAALAGQDELPGM